MKLSTNIQVVVIIQVIILITISEAQYPCSCSCCLGPNCLSSLVGYVYATNCSQDNCLSFCKTNYYQCSAQPPYGQSNAQCLSSTTIAPATAPYSCRCDCCNAGTASCTPTLTGYTTAYSCASGACSIACTTQYPLACISNQYGQTQGTCLGLTSTAGTTTTTTASWLGNSCSCYCCQSGPYCMPNTNVGNTSSYQCSTYSCTLACQNQYPSLCPSRPYLGKSFGKCSNNLTGSTQCLCKCCGTYGCQNYNVSTDADCSSCPSLCQQQTQCVNSYQIKYDCESNSGILLKSQLFQITIFIVFIQFILI